MTLIAVVPAENSEVYGLEIQRMTYDSPRGGRSGRSASIVMSVLNLPPPLRMALSTCVQMCVPAANLFGRVSLRLACVTSVKIR